MENSRQFLNNHIMAEKIYHCAYCAETVTTSSSPSQGGCKVKRTHWWVTIGEVGTRKLTCKNCNLTVSVKSSAQQVGCTKAQSHYWQQSK